MYMYHTLLLFIAGLIQFIFIVFIFDKYKDKIYGIELGDNDYLLANGAEINEKVIIDLVN